MNESGQEITELSVTPEKLVDLIKLREAGTVSVTAAKQVLSEIFETGEEPKEAVERLGLVQISDTDALTSVIQEVVAGKSQAGTTISGGENPGHRVVHRAGDEGDARQGKPADGARITATRAGTSTLEA